MHDLISLTAEKVRNVVQRMESITLSNLESTVDASFNLFFLAIDRLTTDHKITIKRGGRDYLVSIQKDHFV